MTEHDNTEQPEIVHTPSEEIQYSNGEIICHILIQRENNQGAPDNQPRTAWCGKTWVPNYVSMLDKSLSFVYCQTCVDRMMQYSVIPMMREHQSWLDNLAERWNSATVTDEFYIVATNIIMSGGDPSGLTREDIVENDIINNTNEGQQP